MNVLRSLSLANLAILALTAGGAPVLAVDRAAPVSAWSEVDWPFLRDAWPKGRAFACKAADCGVDVGFYARLKVGFCDCAKGVADDDEVDRVGDVDLVWRDFRPLAQGDPVKLSGMEGRKRLYVTNERQSRYVLVFAGGRNCNAFVAMAISTSLFSPRAIDAAQALMGDSAFMRWVEAKESGD